MTNEGSLDPTVRYVKNHISKEVWLKARSLAVIKGQPITKWVEDAMREKIRRESK
jgi:hypothetical protein